MSENFQLHTLLMHAFGRPVDPEVLAIARGDGPQQGDQEVAGAWNLYTYRALRDGRLPEPDASQSEEWISDEGVPAVIPAIDGTRVILLGEPLYERTWNAVRTFPGLAARLDAERALGAGRPRVAGPHRRRGRQRRWVGEPEELPAPPRGPRGRVPPATPSRSLLAQHEAALPRGGAAGRSEAATGRPHLPTQPPLTCAGAPAPARFLSVL